MITSRTWRGERRLFGVLASGEFGLLHSWLLSLLDRGRRSGRFSDPLICSGTKPVPTNRFYQSTIFQLVSNALRVQFSATVCAFSESEKLSLNVKNWHSELLILSLRYDTRLYVMSLGPSGRVDLLRSICCANDAVGRAGFTNLLRWDILASTLFVTVPINWLLAKAKWWTFWMMQKKVFFMGNVFSEKSFLRGSVD